MPERVLVANEVSINGKKYRVVGPVKQILASAYAPKQVFGDYGPDNRPDVSVAFWNDWRGGVNLEYAEKQDDMNRAWWSDCYLRSKGHLVPGPLVTLTAAPTSPPASYSLVIGEVGNAIFAAHGTDVRKYTNSNDSWSASLDTLPAAATDVLTVTMGGTTYLVFAHTGGYTYSSDEFASAGTDDTTDTLYMAWWDNRLWGISAAGQLWYATTIGTEINDALLPLAGAAITSLFVGPDASGEEILYAGTTTGLYAHDFANSRWVPTKLQLPRQANNGKGAIEWRGKIYYPAGVGIYEYDPVAGTIRAMGLDRDSGIVHLQDTGFTRSHKGHVVKLVGTHNELLAAVDTTQIGTGSLWSVVMGWDGQGWQRLWQTNTADIVPDWIYASGAYSLYRLWIGSNKRVEWLTLNPNLENPTGLYSFAFDTASNSNKTHLTPWFTAGDIGTSKLALRVRVETVKRGAGAGSATLKVEYQTNFSTTATTLGTITTGDYALTEYNLGGTNPIGIEFRAIRFALTFGLAGSDAAADMLSLQLDYRKKVPVKWGFEMMVSLQDPYGGTTVPQMRANLITAVEAATLVEFTDRDDASSGNPRNFYVDTLSFETNEATGPDEKGTAIIRLVER